MNIGSGKLMPEDRKGIRHHLIDIVDPDFSFSAGDFVRKAHSAALDILARKKIPLFTGGTGLYIDSFFKGLSEIPELDKSVREKICDELSSKGLENMHLELARVDPDFASRIHPRDSQRIIRGLEVFRGTGRTLSSFHNSRKGYETEATLYIGIYEDREKLRNRIDQRVDQMIKMGLVDEVKLLKKMGYGSDLKSMRSIGYSEIHKYLDKNSGLQESIDKIKIETKKYAKRQMTWFRRNSRINWFNTEDLPKAGQFVKKWLDDIIH